MTLLGWAGLLFSLLLSLSWAGLGWATATAGRENDVTGLGYRYHYCHRYRGLGWAAASAGGQHYDTSCPRRVRTPQVQALVGEHSLNSLAVRVPHNFS